MKVQSSRHGIPDVIQNDGGPQFALKDFVRFCKEYSIVYKNLSPCHPSANGEVTRAVQTVKHLLSAYEVKNNLCLIESPFKISIFVLEISTFFYYANLISDDVILFATKKWKILNR